MERMGESRRENEEDGEDGQDGKGKVGAWNVGAWRNTGGGR